MRTWMHARTWLQGILFSWVLMSISACSSDDLLQYQNQTPKLVLSEFFNGPLVATGMVLDRSGNVSKRFQVEMQGSWQQQQGVLDETFYWDDGSTSKRIWYLTDLGQGRYQGQAADVLNTAQGQAVGSVLNWRYQLQLPPEQGGWVLDFDDTMVLVTEDELLNVATMSKFGLALGQVILTIRKVGS